jgi:hypothetical protein
MPQWKKYSDSVSTKPTKLGKVQGNRNTQPTKHLYLSNPDNICISECIKAIYPHVQYCP